MFGFFLSILNTLRAAGVRAAERLFLQLSEQTTVRTKILLNYIDTHSREVANTRVTLLVIPLFGLQKAVFGSVDQTVKTLKVFSSS